MNLVKVAIGVLSGVVAGTLIGVLYAPEKGSKMRKQILSKGEDYSDTLKEKFDELFHKFTKKFEGAWKDTEELFHKTKNKHNEVKKEDKNTSV